MLLIRSISILTLFFVYSSVLLGQEKIDYTLSVSSNEGLGSYDFLGIASKPLRFNWSVEQDPFTLDSKISGRLKIIASVDSVLSPNDIVVLDSVCTLELYSYGEKPVRHKLKPGSYYLFTTYYASDQKKFRQQSNTVRKCVQLFDLQVSISEAWFSNIKVSEYNEETLVHLEVDISTSCCLPLLGPLSSQWEIGVAKNKFGKREIVQSFYRTDSLEKSKIKLIMEETLFGAPDFANYKFMTVNLTSAYFSGGYRTIPDWSTTVPIKVIRDSEQLNEVRRSQYPFLTYGSFIMPDDSIKKIEVDQLQRESTQFYSLVASSLELSKARKTKEAIQWADSAFAFAGSHRLSSLIFVQPSIVADVYSGLIKLMRTNNLLNDEDQEKLNFRLGEAMKMEDLMNTGYQKLVTTVLPDTLSILSDLEESGYYYDQDVFRQSNITDLPILWRERSVPALKHFVRTIDFETADQIVTQVDQHVDLVRPIWQLLATDTALNKHYTYLANTLSEHNEMLDYQLTKLQLYAEAGLYQDGEQAIRDAVLAHKSSYQFVPTDLWLAVGRFYESLGNYQKADSLYTLCDTYFKNKKESVKENGAGQVALHLKTRNQALLQAKLSDTQIDSKTGEEIASELEILRIEEKSFFLYLDLLSNHTLAQKAGFLHSPVYPNFYLNQIKQLESQGKYFLANEWTKELAFFQGRDGKLNNSVFLYENLFTIEKLKAIAFRLGFSEETQIFYSQKQQETLSRFLNVVMDYKEAASPEKYDSLLTTCLEQVLFNHSYVLRGNFQLLYDVVRSENEQVQRLQIVWQSLREYLNELYIKEEPDKKGMALVKKEILETEKNLIRLARDTISMRLDYIPPVDSIRKKLGVNDAAIEIIRYEVNHKIFYGKKIKYAALVVRKNGALQLIPFAEDGTEMEGKLYKRYRNSIQFKLNDELSYNVFWKPLAKSLEGIKKIYWAPEGVFHLINLNTLYNPDTKKYLLDEMQIHTVPTIAQLHRESPLAITSATLLGNPIYSEHPNEKKQDSVRTSREFLSRQAITRLPGTKTEIETIAQIIKKTNTPVTTLTEAKATKQALFKSNQVDVIHLATHGFWLDKKTSGSGYHNLFESLSSSGLILAGAQQKESSDNYKLLPQGILTSAEIQDMNLFKTKLVVLSACETGLGELVPGEGIYGLKRALQKAGVQNTITSLWKVDDEATMQFMSRFYQTLLETKNLSGSFQQAMSSLKQKFPDPYYWGAFILTEN